MITEILRGASGQTPWKNVANENAWSALLAFGTFNSAVIKFQVSPISNNMKLPVALNNYGLQSLGFSDDVVRYFDYPANPQSYWTGLGEEGVYVKEGISASGVYSIRDRIGGLYGRFSWSGGDENTLIYAQAVTQMV